MVILAPMEQIKCHRGIEVDLSRDNYFFPETTYLKLSKTPNESILAALSQKCYALKDQVLKVGFCGSLVANQPCANGRSGATEVSRSI